MMGLIGQIYLRHPLSNNFLPCGILNHVSDKALTGQQAENKWQSLASNMASSSGTMDVLASKHLYVEKHDKEFFSNFLNFILEFL